MRGISAAAADGTRRFANRRKGNVIEVARTLFALVVAGLIAGCGGGQQPQKQKPAPATRAPDFVGIYADDVYYGDTAYRRQTLEAQHAAGVRLIRQPFSWADDVENPARYDDFVAAAATAGIRVLPVLLGPDPGRPTGSGGMRPPAAPERFAGWAALMVQRYGPDGSLWKSHPKLPKLPITSWQVWNEPNIAAFWAPEPDAVAYANLLRETAAAIRKVAPHAEVVAAGLPTSHLGVPAAEFLADIYKAGAKGSFDAAAVHPYAASPDAVVERVKSLERVIGDNNDDVNVWVTEVGWGTGGKPGPLTVSPARQADYVKQTLSQLHALGVRCVVVFQWRDPKPFPGRRPIWPYYAGLLDQDGKPKPSLAAFKEAAAAVSR